MTETERRNSIRYAQVHEQFVVDTNEKPTASTADLKVPPNIAKDASTSYNGDVQSTKTVGASLRFHCNVSTAVCQKFGGVTMKHREKLFKLLRECVETPQESFAVEEMIRKVNGDMPKIETVSDTKKTFNGINFYRDGRGNYLCSITLHRFVWCYANGEIPDGCEIHHRDFNHDNNDIANLELVTKDEH